MPHYCSGCPHNTSTRVPEGSRALAGIGCHYMATWIYPTTTQTFSQMGGEGVAWIGQAPFTETPHVFANLGDGTYFHSGILAIRAAAAAGVNITYKILYNDAVAMTGGQPLEGSLSVAQLVGQLAAEGLERIEVVADEAEAANIGALPAGVRVRPRERAGSGPAQPARDQGHHGPDLRPDLCRREAPPPQARQPRRPGPPRGHQRHGLRGLRRLLEQVQLRLGAAGRDRVGHASARSTSPTATRTIPASTASARASSPSRAARCARARRWPAPATCRPCPTPDLPGLAEPWGILITGIGGTGVVTIGAILCMAAHLEGKGVTALDMAGLAQKGGSVWSHVRIAADPGQLWAPRIAAGEADAVIGCDIVVTVGDESLAKMQQGRTRAVVNSDASVTSEFVRTVAEQARTGDLQRFATPSSRPRRWRTRSSMRSAPGRRLVPGRQPSRHHPHGRCHRHQHVHARLRLAARPRPAGRGVDPARDRAQRRRGRPEPGGLPVGPPGRPRPGGARSASRRRARRLPDNRRLSASLDEVIARRVAYLTAYQDAAYAERYRALVEQVRKVEAERIPGSEALTEAVARNLHKLMAYKDEYEVARLYTDTGFLERVAGMFEGDWKLRFHLAPPLIAGPDPVTGEPREARLRPVDAARLPPAGAAQAPARHSARPVRPHGRAARSSGN